MTSRDRKPARDDFWNFSVEIYAEEGVDSECLALQDQHGVDVNVLLFCAYLGARGIELLPREIGMIIAVVRPWHEMIVKPLRGTRRVCKSFIAAPSFPARKSAASLRAKIKALELVAEGIEQALLEDWASDRLRSAGHRKRSSLVAKNIALYLRRLRVPGGQGHARRLIAAAG
jgi:uncharacterized protein (TIGR02444 family)